MAYQVKYAYKTDVSAGEISAFVHHPAPSDKQHPIVLVFHGGGCITGSAEMTPAAEIDYLVNDLGFVVVNAEYRLSPQVSIYEGAMTDARDLLSWSRSMLPALLKERGVHVDPQRVAAMGHSSGGHIAMTLGSAPQPPKVILDCYGTKFLSDKHYSTPMAVFAAIPDQDLEFMAKVHEGPVPTSDTAAFVKGKPDLSTPRHAFLFMGMKHGTQIADVVKDGNIDRCDPATMFTKDWPPTAFLHGTADFIIPSKFSVQAFEKLKELGVECELILAEGKPHGFDMQIGNDPGEGWADVAKALDFLKKHV